MKYDSLNAFKAAKQRARDERDGFADHIELRWTRLKDPVMRGILLKDAAMDLVRAGTTGDPVQGLLRGNAIGPLLSTLGFVFASTRKGWVKRIVFSSLNLVLGKLMRPRDAGGSGLLTRLAQGIGGMMRRVR